MNDCGHGQSPGIGNDENENVVDLNAFRFFNISSDILCTFAFDGSFKSLNPAFTRILGWELKEAYLKPWVEFIHPDDLEKATEAFKDLTKGIARNQVRIRSLHKDGSYRYISWNSLPVVKDALIFSAGRDVTDLKALEEALESYKGELERRIEERTASLNEINEKLAYEISVRNRVEHDLKERESRLKEAQSMAHLGSWEYDVLTDHLNWSDEIFRIFEIDSSKFGASYSAFINTIHPDDRDTVNQAYTSSLINKTPYEIIHRLKLPDGRIKHVHEKCRTFYDDAGNPIRSVGTVQDITEQRMFEESLAQSEQKFRLVAETINDVFWISELGLSRLIYVSPGYEKVWGRPTSSLYQAPDTFLDAVHPDDYELAKKMMTQFHAKGLIYSYEYRIVQPNGSVRWIFERGFPVVDSQGEITSICGVSTDITERKNIEERLRKSERQYRLVVEKSSDVIWILDPYSQMFSFVSAGVKNVFGYTTEEAMAIPMVDWLAPEWKTMTMNALKSLIDGESRSFVLELEVFQKSGKKIWCEITASRWRDEDSGLVQIAGASRDISDRKLVEESLKSSEERFRQVSELTGEWIWEVDKRGMFIFCSSAVKNIIGYSPEELVNRKTCWEIIASVDEYESNKCFRNQFDLMQEYHALVCEYVHRDGSTVTIESSGFPVRDAEGNFEGFSGTNKDISERVRATESRELLAAVVESGMDSVVVTDTKGTIKYVNPGFERSSGYSSDEALGLNPRVLKSGLQDDRFYRNLWETITAGRVWSGHFINRRKDGTLFEEDAAISPIFNAEGQITNYVAVKRDVTREMALQKQLFQSQKMEAIGTLAGGIAHDFNNIIFAIIGYTELALDSLPNDGEARKDLMHVLDASSRAADMVRQILTFSRQTELEKKPIDIGPLVKEGVKFLRATIPSTIGIRQQIEPSIGNIMANPTQMHQVLMNLCTNAAHSMRDSKGTMTIRLNQIHLDQEFCSRHALESPGNYVRLTVEDTGHGIPPEIIQKIFEPYFTTKKIDEGTGMGLAVVHGIVTSHGGAMTVKSTPGVGSVFEVFFPVIESGQDAGSLADVSSVPAGVERILLLEDEDIILEMEKAMLQHLGYQVTAARDPEQALQIFSADPKAFDLVITDLTMPRMTGIEVTTQIHRIRQDISVILCTGYGNRLSEEQIEQSGLFGVIQKPIRKKEMAQTIRKALDLKKRDFMTQNSTIT